MPDPQPEDVSAELLILEDMGVDPEKLKRVNTKAAADKLIQYYNSKTSKKEETEQKPPELKLKANMGHSTSPLPPPDAVDPLEIKMNLGEKLDPLSIKHAYNSRRNHGARIMVLFTPDHPNGRAF